MEKFNLYINRIPFKALFFLKLLIGLFLISFFLIQIKNEVYYEIMSIAGPLLGIALIINGLSGRKIKEINLNTTNKCIEIKRESIFKTKIKEIDSNKMAIELKTANGKKNSLIPKIRLIILENDKEIEMLESDILSLNNEKIEKLYSDLKAIKRASTSNS